MMETQQFNTLMPCSVFCKNADAEALTNTLSEVVHKISITLLELIEMQHKVSRCEALVIISSGLSNATIATDASEIRRGKKVECGMSLVMDSFSKLPGMAFQIGGLRNNSLSELFAIMVVAGISQTFNTKIRVLTDSLSSMDVITKSVSKSNSPMRILAGMFPTNMITMEHIHSHSIPTDQLISRRDELERNLAEGAMLTNELDLLRKKLWKLDMNRLADDHAKFARSLSFGDVRVMFL